MLCRSALPTPQPLGDKNPWDKWLSGWRSHAGESPPGVCSSRCNERRARSPCASLRPRVRKFPSPVPSCNIRAKILPSYLTGGERTPWKALRHSINSNVCHALGGNARNAWTDPKKQPRDPLVPGGWGGWFHSSQNEGCSENKGRLNVPVKTVGLPRATPKLNPFPADCSTRESGKRRFGVGSSRWGFRSQFIHLRGEPPSRLLFSVCRVSEPRLCMKDEGACLVLEKYRMDFNSQLTPSCTFVVPICSGRTDDLQESCQDLCLCSLCGNSSNPVRCAL